MKTYSVRWVVSLAGIACIALGVVLTTKANLGTTPITAIPYVASLGFTPSVGFFTIALNLLLVVLQIAVLRRRFPAFQYLQIPVTCMFGFLIDMWMWLLPEATGSSYGVKVLALAAGVLILAFGVYLEMAADVVMMAGEGAVRTIALLAGKDFGLLKTVFDVSLVTVGVGLSLVLFNEIRGIGPGTVLSAVFVGIIVRMLVGRWPGMVRK